MVEAPLRAETLLIAAVGLAALQTAGFFTATGTAIMLAPITVTGRDKTPPGREESDTRAGEKTVEQATGTGFEREHWTTGDDHGRMTLAMAWRSF